MNERLMQWVHEASGVLWFLGVLSVTALAIGLERLSQLVRSRSRLRASRNALGRHIHDDKEAAAAAVALTHSDRPHIAQDLLAQALTTPAPSGQALRRQQQVIVRALRRRVWLLGTIGNLAPFVGLLGTVLGVMDAFVAIAQSGGGGFEVVSRGISEALTTTAAGIFVGIEAVVLYNGLQILLGHYSAELRDTLEELVEARDGHAQP